MRSLLQVLPEAPDELTRTRLQRLGEGVGKVVYASRHWVVKRERSNNEVIALILVWKMMRRMERMLPGRLGRDLLAHPSHQLRFLRVAFQSLVSIVPRGLWFGTHIGEMWRLYRHRDRRGEILAVKHLSGTSVMPEVISFPPARVRIGGWRGWLTVSEATERVEANLMERLETLARDGRHDEMRMWLQKFVELRRSGWSRGVYSVDAHLKNFGVTEDRVVLLDAGGLTDHIEEVAAHLEKVDRFGRPHEELGLGPVLAGLPEIAGWFDALWRSSVNIAAVRQVWPTRPAS